MTGLLRKLNMMAPYGMVMEVVMTGDSSGYAIIKRQYGEKKRKFFIEDDKVKFCGKTRKLTRLSCWDNGGKTCDRYTVVFLDEPSGPGLIYAGLGMSSSPFHPQGFGMHVNATPGTHLGKKISFDQLPDDCKRLVSMDMGTSLVQNLGME
ncbi:hypothetical protein UFOVP142_3 [uncultured Caudovirales phage]|uniref:Uncharacterized protein n=1 Tax=uncultured Caudovirales phage TaxID=2100421 RepID=A0A6J7XJM1_9CAUD|nr:hypothetical protein UFOVP142_3 [uncultured Caudovirales phage]